MPQENSISIKQTQSNIPVAIRIILVILGTLFIGGLFSFIASLIYSGDLENLRHAQDMSLKENFFFQGAGFIGSLAVIFFFAKISTCDQFHQWDFILKEEVKIYFGD